MTVLRDPGLRRIALVRLRVGLGDLLCSLPAWRALRQFRPDLHVTVVTWPEMAPVLARMAPYVDDLLPFPGYSGIPERPARSRGLPAFLSAARARRFDLAIQCYGDNAAASEVTGMLGATRVGGFRGNGASIEHGPLELPYPRDLHEVWRHLRLVEHLGVELSPAAGELEFPVTAREHAEWERLAERCGLRRDQYVVLHPGATSTSRRWPVDRFAVLADVLARRGLRVVLGGVRAERPLTAEVARLMHEPALDLAGQTTLGVYALLLRHGRLLVGNDTGAAHLAAAVGGRTVTIFLSGDPTRWAHCTPRHQVARVSVGCNPCPHLDCPIDFRCAHRLTVRHVLSQVDSVDDPASS
jgi:ADP-heptose:LPS heptosyltransferase